MGKEEVLDASVFIHGKGTLARFENPVTVPSVTRELESEDSRLMFDARNIRVLEPSEESEASVRQRAEELSEELSDTDVELVALALERGAEIISDDYGVQNVASSLGVDHSSFLTEGIKRTLEWEIVCSSCGRKGADPGRCRVCGGEMKRTPSG